MTGTLLAEPVIRAVNAAGVPISGAKLQFYVTGTTTPTPAYSSAGLGTPLANPVIADAGGLFAPIYLDPAVVYRCQLLDGGGTLIRDVDPVNGVYVPAAGSITGAMLASGAATSNIGYVPLNKAGDTALNLAVSITTPGGASAGYLGIPPNEQDASYTFVLSDSGKFVRTIAPGATTYTIPLVATVPFPAGTTIVVRNAGSATLTVARAAGVTLTAAGTATNKDWAVAAGGLATLILEGGNVWVISGVGVS